MEVTVWLRPNQQNLANISFFLGRILTHFFICNLEKNAILTGCSLSSVSDFVSYFGCVVLGIEPRALYMLHKHSTIELYLVPFPLALNSSFSYWHLRFMPLIVSLYKAYWGRPHFLSEWWHPVRPFVSRTFRLKISLFWSTAQMKWFWSPLEVSWLWNFWKRIASVCPSWSWRRMGWGWRCLHHRSLCGMWNIMLVRHHNSSLTVTLSTPVNTYVFSTPIYLFYFFLAMFEIWGEMPQPESFFGKARAKILASCSFFVNRPHKIRLSHVYSSEKF